MRRLKLLDLFCGAGGASMGYHRAGFDVVGVDIAPQKNYPFAFHQGDALEFVSAHGSEFDVIHASPPCQAYSTMSACRPGLADGYPDLVDATRNLLESVGRPWVIENVPGAPMRNPVMLCGMMFGFELYRHRLFEASFPLEGLLHPAHVKPASRAGHWVPGTVMSVSGHIAPVAHARQIMDIGWTNREELAEAIPPYYTEFIGHQMMSRAAATTSSYSHLSSLSASSAVR